MESVYHQLDRPLVPFSSRLLKFIAVPRIIFHYCRRFRPSRPVKYRMGAKTLFATL